ncbi:hypothetical protein [Mycolicibacterium neoaurum]|nr:hypothetical protein [Mycolicibacterium neoaurum]
MGRGSGFVGVDPAGIVQVLNATSARAVKVRTAKMPALRRPRRAT